MFQIHHINVPNAEKQKENEMQQTTITIKKTTIMSGSERDPIIKDIFRASRAIKIYVHAKQAVKSNELMS